MRNIKEIRYYMKLEQNKLLIFINVVVVKRECIHIMNYKQEVQMKLLQYL